MSNNVELILSTQGNDLERQNVPTGLSRCAVKSIIDFGVQPTEWGDKHQIEITFEFPEHTGVFDEQEKPLFISKRFTLSLHPKAALHKAVVQMYGKALPDDFNVYQILGKNLMANVIHVDKDNTTYANIDSFAPLMNGLTDIKQADQVAYLIGMENQEAVIDKLPEWKQDRIRAAKNYPFG